MAIYTLTTDFGPTEYVGAMKGAILSIDREANVVDLDHSVRPQDVRQGAYVLYAAAPSFPFAAHIGVVDPGVGTARRALVIVAEGAFLVGPDNGLLLPAARRLGIKEVRSLTNPKLMAKDVSSTFHGRDVFAPAAAHLMTGAKVKDVGPVVTDYVDLDFGTPRRTEEGFDAEVITPDRFGNLITNLPRRLAEGTWSFGDRLRIIVGGYEMDVPLVRTYGEVESGEYLATFSSSGFLEVSKREGSAAAYLHVGPEAPVFVGAAEARHI